MTNPKKGHRIAPEVKTDIIRRIKEEGVSVPQAAKDHGVHESTIYGWLGTGAQYAVMGGIHSSSEAAQGTLRSGGRSGGRAHREIEPSSKKELTEERNKTQLAKAVGVSRASLYYKAKKLDLVLGKKQHHATPPAL